MKKDMPVLTTQAAARPAAAFARLLFAAPSLPYTPPSAIRDAAGWKLLMVAMLLAAFGLAPVAPLTAQSPEREALKLALQKEAQARVNRLVYNSLQLEAEPAQRMVLNEMPNTRSFTWYYGIMQPSTFTKKGAEGRLSTVVANLSNFHFILHHNHQMAWVYYDLATKNKDAYVQAGPSVRQLRMLVKQEDQWQVMSKKADVEELLGEQAEALKEELNQRAYFLLWDDKGKEALEVFRLNLQLFPHAWEVHEGLAEAYARSGNRELAIRHYQKLLKLYPLHPHGTKALLQLQHEVALSKVDVKH